MEGIQKYYTGQELSLSEQLFLDCYSNLRIKLQSLILVHDATEVCKCDSGPLYTETWSTP